MITPYGIVIAMLALSIILAATLMLRPRLSGGTGGKILTFTALCVLPILSISSATSQHIERSKQTSFCLSCHVMEPYGKSLHADNGDQIPALHFQNQYVPKDSACYTCHTNYTMYGGLHSKIRGLRHVYANYLGHVPAKIKLYEPYNNRECLHCHEGSKRFEESVGHTADEAEMQKIKSGQESCLTAECHYRAHYVNKAEKKAELAKGATK